MFSGTGRASCKTRSDRTLIDDDQNLEASSAFGGLDGLLAADSPLEWAWDNLDAVAAGDTASLFAHPILRDRVVRVTDYPDGWFAYADAMSRVTEPWACHAPTFDAMAVVEGEFIAITEKLSSPSEEQMRLVEFARAYLLETPMDIGDRRELQTSQPHFEAFAENVRMHKDFRPSNWMFRGEVLVLNDPSRAMSHEMAAEITERYPPPAVNRSGFNP